MEALANRGKYKVIDRLESGGGYEAFTAVDIEAREHAEVLVNRYGDPEIHTQNCLRVAGYR